MTVIEFMTVITALITGANFFYNYVHLRKKDLQDKLYTLKFDSYQAMIKMATQTMQKIDLPVNELIALQPREQMMWIVANTSKFTSLYDVTNEMLDAVTSEALILPKDKVNLTIAFVKACNAFIQDVLHLETPKFDSGTKGISDAYHNLINGFKQDLGFEQLDKELTTRLAPNEIQRTIQEAVTKLQTKLKSFQKPPTQ